MQFYFFKRIDKEYIDQFGSFANKQNVITSKLLCLIVASISILIRILALFINFDNYIANIHEYKRADNFILSSSLLCYLLLFAAKKLIYRKRYVAYRFISLSYAAALIIGCLWITFVAQHNPSNTISMFLIGMVCVSVLYILKLGEITTITALTTIIFFAGLQYYQPDPGKMYLNYMVGLCVLTAFYAISRVTFSYHYNYFLQLRNVEKKKDEISKINLQQTEILNIVAHDLRSPINNIASLVDLLKNAPLSEKERLEYYDMMLFACGETDHIIHELIEDVRNSSTQKLDMELVCLNDLLESLYKRWSVRLQGSRYMLFHNDIIKVYSYVHAGKLVRVIDNLINNARKFTSEDCSIQIFLKHTERDVQISIGDNGIGIPESLQPYLFDRFSRAGRKGLQGEQSYGIGLSICKQLIEQHNGSITMESKENYGTTFHIELPLAAHGHENDLTHVVAAGETLLG
jgi:signal transduction histidine kinase